MRSFSDPANSVMAEDNLNDEGGKGGDYDDAPAPVEEDVSPLSIVPSPSDGSDAAEGTAVGGGTFQSQQDDREASLAASSAAIIPKLKLNKLVAGAASAASTAELSGLSSASTWRRPSTAPRALFLQPPSRCSSAYQDYQLQQREQTPRSATARRPATGSDALSTAGTDPFAGTAADALGTRDGTGSSVPRSVRLAVAMSRKPRVVEEALGDLRCRYACDTPAALGAQELWTKSGLHTLSGTQPVTTETAEVLRKQERVAISTFYDASGQGKVSGARGQQRGR